MAYVVVSSPCVNCGRIFSYNPHRVPSIVVDGEREPVCRQCIYAENARRELLNGVTGEHWELLPAPHPDAYEPIHESEL